MKTKEKWRNLDVKRNEKQALLTKSPITIIFDTFVLKNN